MLLRSPRYVCSEACLTRILALGTPTLPTYKLPEKVLRIFLRKPTRLQVFQSAHICAASLLLFQYLLRSLRAALLLVRMFSSPPSLPVNLFSTRICLAVRRRALFCLSLRCRDPPAGMNTFQQGHALFSKNAWLHPERPTPYAYDDPCISAYDTSDRDPLARNTSLEDRSHRRVAEDRPEHGAGGPERAGDAASA